MYCGIYIQSQTQPSYRNANFLSQPTMRIDTAATGEHVPDASHMLPLARLGQWLLEEGYRFTTATPATHARINARPGAELALCLRDIFGWSRPFARTLLPDAAMTLLEESGVVRAGDDGLLHCTVRFSTLGDAIYMHSAYPTLGEDAVFFGPDTYRFAALIERTLAATGMSRVERILDLGCGSGAGGMVAWKTLQARAGDPPPELLLTDINASALDCARVNAAIAGIPGVIFLEGDLYQPIAAPVDLIVANPPYLLDPQQRLYRHGGGEFGGGLSTRIVVEGLPLLRPGGTMILYTGAPIINGRDTFLASVKPHLKEAGLRWDYNEIDPDVFGEELESPAYERVDRIAAVGLVVHAAAS
jgi:methylase of polypeptide subunit release factors